MQEPVATEGPEEAAPLLLQQYLALRLQQHLALRAAPAGVDEAALRAQARRVLRARRGGGGIAVRGVAERCRRARGRSGLLELLRALELLERLCLNLLLCPWRREIRSLKTFTGTFVYYIQPVLPDEVITAVLEKMGYVATTATEFSLLRRGSDEETKQTALEIFLARIECETILEMTAAENHGDVGEPPQRGAQGHQHDRGKDGEDQSPQREGAESLADEADGETSLCLAACQASVAASGTFEAAGSVMIKDAVAQPAAPAPGDWLRPHQGQAPDSRCFPGRCSDSEDFLTTYNDIVIRQTPVFSEGLCPQAAEQPGAALSDGSALAVTAGPPADETGPVPLSPGASGPPAFALFADGSCDSRTAAEFRARGVPGRSIEAEINDAMNCTEPCPADEPRELKSLPYRAVASAQNSSAPREEEVSELSLTFTKLQIKDTQEDMMFPVEETGRPKSELCTSPSNGRSRELSRCRMHRTYATQMQNRAAACTEPSSELCCSGNTEGPTTGSDSKRFLVGTPGPEGFRHLREPPTLTYLPPQSFDVQSSHARGSSTQGRRNLLQPERDSAEGSEAETCSADSDEIQEPYVVIDRTEQGMLCYRT